MNWAVLALLAASDATGNATYLDAAHDLFSKQIMPAWDTQSCGGGVWWDLPGHTKTASWAGHTQKATASNAGPALAAALLSTRIKGSTGEDIGAWGKLVFSYWNETMSNASTGAVIDHVKCSKGSCEPVLWDFTYNEGLMLGAATALGHARDSARFVGRIVMDQTTPGGVLRDSCECSHSLKALDCQSFKGVAIRELKRWLESPVSSEAEDPALVAAAARVVKASAQAVWSTARQQNETGRDGGPLFTASWASAGQGCLLNAAAQTSAVLALIAAV